MNRILIHDRKKIIGALFACGYGKKLCDVNQLATMSDWWLQGCERWRGNF